MLWREEDLTRKMDKPNEGIRCVVNTCEYYMNGDHCALSRYR